MLKCMQLPYTATHRSTTPTHCSYIWFRRLYPTPHTANTATNCTHTHCTQIHHAHALLLVLGSGAYTSTKASSSVVTSLVTSTPVIADAATLAAYRCVGFGVCKLQSALLLAALAGLRLFPYINYAAGSHTCPIRICCTQLYTQGRCFLDEAGRR